MATHRVPQDVEADDKLLGPLSLKQFIFIVLGLGFGYLTFFFFSRIHPISALIWLPPTIVFLVLGGYQRKDQPVEVFLMSALRFYLKPRKRKWDQEGYEERVKITAPPKIEHHYTKSFTGEEAVSRLTKLSHMMDSRGWASKVATDWQNPQFATAAASETDRLVTAQDVASVQPFDAQHYVTPVDVMDDQTSLVSRQFTAKIQQVDTTAKQQAIQTLQQARQDTSGDPAMPDTVSYQQYPEMRQKVIQPATEEYESTTSPTPPQLPPQPAAEPVVSIESAEPENKTKDNSHDGGVEISLR